MRRILGLLAACSVAIMVFLGVATLGCAAERQVLRIASIQSSCARDHSCTPIDHGKKALRIAFGAECPVGSKTYCGDDLPWCCVAANGTSYCAKDTASCNK
jgi:hypothetical protein